MAYCYYCGTEITDPRNIGRSSGCSSCGKDLKVCLNCAFYDPNAHWECRESIPERVADKERSNFCDYFVFSNRKPGKAAGPGKAEQARSELDKLFGNG